MVLRRMARVDMTMTSPPVSLSMLVRRLWHVAKLKHLGRFPESSDNG